MSKFITKFETTAAYEAEKDSLFKPNVSLVKDNGEVHYAPIIKVSGVSLNKNELSLEKGETETLIATVLPNNASNKGVTWSSSNDNVATVRSNGLVTAVGGGNANITVTTVDGGYTAQCVLNATDPYGGHDYVEIGGLKWATMNVGANSVTDTGLYFQWGDTQGYTASQVGSGEGKKNFGWADYKYSKGNSNPSAISMRKYNSTDGKKVLEPSDDAVTAAWGGAWRMPTQAEFQALSVATTSVWTTNYEGSGIRGLVLTSTADSSKKLFFPACGTSIYGVINSGGKYGYYWSSSLESSSAMYADIMFFDKNSVNWQTHMNRCSGIPVRGVVG